MAEKIKALGYLRASGKGQARDDRDSFPRQDADEARDTAMWLLLGSPKPERVADAAVTER